MNLSAFISRIPNFAALAKRPSKLVPYFALFLELGDDNSPISPSAIDRLYDEARSRRPTNTSDIIRKSKSFVRMKAGGYKLAHEAREQLVTQLSLGDTSVDVKGAPEPSQVSGTSHSGKDVFVVYGRDSRLRRDLFSFLRTLGLNPLEFDHMARFTGSTSASTWEVIKAGFARAQACVVLFSPDESVLLREDLRGDDDSDEGEMQPRPNVLVEAGMALALHPDRTIIVKVGKVREISDLAGMQYVRLAKDASSRNRLVGKLELAGCRITKHDDWLTTGDFSPESIGR